MSDLDPRGLEAADEIKGFTFPGVPSLAIASAAITAYIDAAQPVVKTVEGLVELPVWTVVEENGGEIRIKSGGDSWFCGCCLEDDFPNEDVKLPVRVIRRPNLCAEEQS